MSDYPFPPFADAVAKKFTALAKANDRLFVVGESNRLLEQVYLSAFPEGTNPIFKERPEYHCNTCFQVLRNVGNVISVNPENGEVDTIWNVKGLEYPFNVVADKLDCWVRSQLITGLFLTAEKTYGAATTRQLIGSGQAATVRTWVHFHAEVPSKFVSQTIGATSGQYSTAVQLFTRGLTELTDGALATTLDLINSNALYRAAEKKSLLTAFVAAKRAFVALPTDLSRNRFVWANAGSPFAFFRNDVLGTLVQDLSEGVDLERAVRSYEVKVAPANYQRPTAVITQGMVEAATKTISELGLEPALDRRAAVLADVSVQDVLWVSGSAKSVMKGVKDLLLKEVAAPKVVPKADMVSMPITKFMAEVLPQTTNLELLVTGSMFPNFMVLTAPTNSEAPGLFKWDNGFAWAYSGGVADSIKERVKKAGGKVEGCALRVSLSWFNFDDLDLHARDPSGNHIYFSNK